MTRVTLNGLTATYRPAELKFMQRLKRTGSEREVAFVHGLMAQFAGRLK